MFEFLFCPIHGVFSPANIAAMTLVYQSGKVYVDRALAWLSPLWRVLP